jgi:alpha-glucosidase
MLLTLRGTPFLYYGEEIGMQNVSVPSDRVCDPVGKRFPALNRDPERTPMRWNAGTNAGFSSNPRTWLPIGDDPGQLNVAAQRNDPSSLLSFYRRVIWHRRENPCLTEGTYRSIESPAGTYVYERAQGSDLTIVALNFEARKISVSLPFSNATLELSTEAQREGCRLQGNRVELDPVEGVVLRVGPS